MILQNKREIAIFNLQNPMKDIIKDAKSLNS